MQVIRDYSPTKLGEFKVKVIYKDEKYFIFDGEFTRDGKSLYSSFPGMNLIAGSQDEDPERAKIKSIMRLLSLLDQRLRYFKSINETSNLFFKDVDSETKNSILEYYTNFLKKHTHDSSEHKIPVFCEELIREGNRYKYSRNYQTEIEDLNNISAQFSDLAKSKISGIEKYDVTVEENITQQSYNIQVPSLV
ncbi:hypothetical protein [Leptospira bouyouniensis]|uniref:hypothetical protein n=1 Tax=Leptospira bouyouniensis TaxID=2484911 RepID=UPI0010915DFA|nr:hypothetical protein [Leptospira bouyouniensis]TGM88277.1 hypothetical protein EHQ99_00230 [Leptospira bouyouniensis]